MSTSLRGGLARKHLVPILVITLLLAASASAHEHEMEDVGPYEDNFMNDEPVDTILQWHIGIQVVTWGLMFPAGMVLGITKSRFHAPFQGVACVLTWTGSWLAHHHGGRAFHTTAHSHFASYLKWYLILQVVLGVFLKLHVMEGSRARRIAVGAHGVIGKTFPVAGWTQMIFGGIATLGFCFGEHFGQCLAHFLMGSAFIAYAMIMLLMMRVGAGFLLRKQVSQEYLDSWVIMVWGIVNTFTEHDFLQKSNHWSHKDMQHVSLGVLWWCGGALGIFLSRNGKRNIVPAVIIGMTGFAMSAHAQSLEFSTNVHKLFGFALMSAGAARIIEVCFVLSDQPSPPTNQRAFQHLPPFLLVLSGLTFLSATEEQMQWIAGSGMDSTTYANILFSTSFIIYLVGAGLLELYERLAEAKSAPPREAGDLENGGGRAWFGFQLPSYFPGQGARLGGPREPVADAYEALPLTASGSAGSSEEANDRERREDRERSIFGVGEEELGEDLEDDGGERFWDEREKSTVGR